MVIYFNTVHWSRSLQAALLLLFGTGCFAVPWQGFLLPKFKLSFFLLPVTSSLPFQCLPLSSTRNVLSTFFCTNNKKNLLYNWTVGSQNNSAIWKAVGINRSSCSFSIGGDRENARSVWLWMGPPFWHCCLYMIGHGGFTLRFIIFSRCSNNTL